MLQPYTSSLVLIDTSTPPAVTSAPSRVLFAARRLSKAASLVSVPMLVGTYPASLPPSADTAAWGIASTLAAAPFDPTPSTWPGSPLGSKLAENARNQVIILGLWLEEAVTLLALNCLSVGYDTYIPIDATVAADAAHQRAAWSRLTQAGAVQTSSAQIIREWAAFCGDEAAHSALMTLLITRPSP